MKTKKCELGKTEFVDEKDVGRGVVLGIDDPKMKIKNNIYQCETGKTMKGDVYGIK